MSNLNSTLIGANHTISQRNIDVIRRLQEQGGRFAVATGRSVSSGGRCYRQVQPEGFCVVLNGPILYDYEQGEIARAFFLPPQARDYARPLTEHFPEISCEVFAQHRQFVLRANQYVRTHLGNENLPCVEIDAGGITDHWYRALCAADPETRLKIQAFTGSFTHPEVCFVQSGKCFLEMLPEGVDKGNGLLEILQQTGLPCENLVVIGDCYNGAEMLHAAGFAAVPSNTPQGIRRMADLVVGDCRDGAVADLIEYLECTE